MTNPLRTDPTTASPSSTATEQPEAGRCTHTRGRWACILPANHEAGRHYMTAKSEGNDR